MENSSKVIVLWAFFHTIILIPSTVANCKTNLEISDCAYDMYCENILNNHYGREHFYFGNNHAGQFYCEPVIWGGSEFYPIHLVLKDSDNTHSTVPNIHNYDGIISIVSQLDVSNNKYVFMPKLHTNLINLQRLILKNNSLIVAQLSETQEFQKLTEIDLSHNIISEIESFENGYPFKSLKTLILAYNSLSSIPDFVLAPFDNLEILDVSHNNIYTIGLMTFEGTINMLHLNFSHNRISDINSSFFRFSGLKSLDLSYNNLQFIKSSDFKNLIHLKTLNCNNNQITTIDGNTFQNMTSLNSLGLRNNTLDLLDKGLFGNASSLIDLDLSNNIFKQLQKGLFKGKRIVKFSITGNQLEGSLSRGTFEGLNLVTSLDLSHQLLESLEDYAFSGLENLEILLLHNNNIASLSIKCFRMLQKLKRLDLSFNKIANMGFEKNDLYNIFSLTLKKNYLTSIGTGEFDGLVALQYLDLSYNKIAHVEPNSFKSLKDLINLEISHNPLNGSLEGKTFEGLNSLPSLDISCTSIMAINNGSFSGMNQIKQLNASHNTITILQYDTFIQTGAIEILDLSYNKLNEFNINITDILNLNTIYLQNNLIKHLNILTWQGLKHLSKINLSHNFIENILHTTFINHQYLQILDMSYNSHLNFSQSLVADMKSLNTLNLSGIKTNIVFNSVGNTLLSQLTMSNSSIKDLKTLHMNEFKQLNTVILSNNEITRLETGIFNNLSALRNLDVSYNKISFIQPGLFKDNTLLNLLNISHNYLIALSYGIFRGLVNLEILDISYNDIKDLDNERFFELSSLRVLIVDHNKIESFDVDDFEGTQLSKLSIGENPIPCDILANIKRKSISYEVTAIRLDENNDENIFGITCNKKTHNYDKSLYNRNSTAVDETVIENIRDILINHFSHTSVSNTNDIQEKYFDNINKQLDKLNSDANMKMSQFINTTEQIVNKSNETNILLEKIFRAVSLISIRKTSTPVTKDNATYENLVSYINKVKQELEESIILEKDVIMSDVEKKLSSLNNQNMVILPSTEQPRQDKLQSSTPTESKTIFTETCVALILIVLVGLILFKIYKSGVFVRTRFSGSTRELPGSMDSAL